MSDALPLNLVVVAKMLRDSVAAGGDHPTHFTLAYGPGARRYVDDRRAALFAGMTRLAGLPFGVDIILSPSHGFVELRCFGRRTGAAYLFTPAHLNASVLVDGSN